MHRVRPSVSINVDEGEDFARRVLALLRQAENPQQLSLWSGPMERGRVLEPEQWRWSSYRHYAYGEAGPVVVKEPQRAEMRVRKVS